MADDNLNDIVSPKQKLIKLTEASLRVTFPDEPNLAPIIAPANKNKAHDYQWQIVRAHVHISQLQRDGVKNTMTAQDLKTRAPVPNSHRPVVLSGKTLVFTALYLQETRGHEAVVLNDIVSPKQKLIKLTEASLRVTFPDEPNLAPIIAPANKNKAHDYQCNNAMSLWARNTGTEFQGPEHIGQAIMLNLPANDIIKSCSVAGPGYVNVNLSEQWMAQFGMLLEYLFEQVPNGEVNDQAIGEIEVFYKASKKRFDDDPEFKKRAQEAVVSLQVGNGWLTGHDRLFLRIRYADLKNNRLTSYKFNYDQMLKDKGDTGVYLQYAHARICSVLQRSGRDIDELKNVGQLTLEHDLERKLGLHLLRFPEAFEEACANLFPHVLCEYLYELAEKFSSFYQACQVLETPEETSRLLLCEATAVVMRKCFHILGITPVYKL
ncbi:hypothetical protein CTI12_AA389530 [Artemisia annua]|uniref:arginine--tRNA ligase n=1 Tax=Artemisia annua TaxID=35608 RepID=A0A2U1MEJ5_ARTAN|nr:hypothetical protein CTI12_AA389530 [Artemisia annua]